MTRGGRENAAGTVTDLEHGFLLGRPQVRRQWLCDMHAEVPRAPNRRLGWRGGLIEPCQKRFWRGRRHVANFLGEPDDVPARLDVPPGSHQSLLSAEMAGRSIFRATHKQ